MDNILQLLRPMFDSVVGLVVLFVVGSFVLYHLAKLKTQRGVALTTLQIIETVLKAKLGDKASKILHIWVEGLRLIQDGEFSKEDAENAARTKIKEQKTLDHHDSSSIRYVIYDD